MLYIYGLLLILYLSFLAVMVVETISGVTRSVKVAYDLTTAVVFINASVNPIIYCWRMKEVRRAIKHYLRTWCFTIKISFLLTQLSLQLFICGKITCSQRHSRVGVVVDLENFKVLDLSGCDKWPGTFLAATMTFSAHSSNCSLHIWNN